YIDKEFIFESESERKLVIAVFIKSPDSFSKANVNLLNTISIPFIADTEDKSFFFFKNAVIEISSENIITRKLDELDGYIWEEDIIDFDFSFSDAKSIVPKGEFNSFISDLSTHKDKKINDQNSDSLTTIIGYLLSRSKNPANPKAIVLMDTYKDGNPHGGTGKGLLSKALKRIRNTAFIDGKTHSSKDKFGLAHVSLGTKILVYDDVPRDFKFEKIFPLVTEDAVVERKYENKFTIPFEDSPKILITTNYTVEGKGSSHRRRKVEFIISDTYDDEYTPEDKFGHLIFLGWGDQEWQYFYEFMIHCVQMFLLMGIVEPKFNVRERALKMNASLSFIDFAKEDLEVSNKYNKREVYEKFYTKFPDHYKIEQNTFTGWLKLYADAKSLQLVESHSGSDNYFEFVINKI
ncbi:MAG: hypothetical protein KAS71_08620, partial [Bacteroidales bacterium]|nr:hypothetical protein [Bacteroidales bacterium]